LGLKILLTNDDGVGSPGILLLAEALRKAGHKVFVFAPASDQSGVSHSITYFHRPCKVIELGEDMWSCEGTPADCVVLALMGGIPETPELVIAGINRGVNLGTDITYSGTAAAARQGSLCNIPSLALSLAEGESWNWDMAVSFVLDRFEQILAYWKPHSFINVNIPNKREKPSALVHAFPAFRYYSDCIDIFRAPDGHRYCFARVEENLAKPEQGSDWAVVEENNASISEIFIHPLMLESVEERTLLKEARAVKETRGGVLWQGIS
jgi:5'-nucleotidase